MNYVFNLWNLKVGITNLANKKQKNILEYEPKKFEPKKWNKKETNNEIKCVNKYANKHTNGTNKQATNQTCIEK